MTLQEGYDLKQQAFYRIMHLVDSHALSELGTAGEHPCIESRLVKFLHILL